MASEIGVQKLMHTNATQAATINSSGQLTIDDGLQKSEGGAVNTSIVQGIAKYWINIDDYNGTITKDSFNATSWTDNGTGLIESAFTNVFDDSGYSCTLGGNQIASIQNATRETNKIDQIYHYTHAGAANDPYSLNITIHGDLA